MNDLTHSADLLGAALEYAKRGWLVFPLFEPQADGTCSCGDPSCGNVGKHPRTKNGLHQATTDPDTISRWWRRWPNANIGIRTGQESGLLVLDVDGEDGEAAMRGLRLQVPLTPVVATGGGGRHYLFRHPGGEFRNTAGKIGLHLDTRGDGGYIVAVGSLHASGQRYEWEISPEECPPADPPNWLLAATQTSKSSSSVAVEEPIPQGQRNSTLASFAGTMRRRGMQEVSIRAALLEENKRCDPPLSVDEVGQIARSVAGYGPAVAPESESELVWDTTESLDSPGRLPLFPDRALPAVLGEFARELAECHQVPIDMPAVAILGSVAAAGAGRFQVSLCNHQEPLNAFYMSVTESGMRKSRTMQDTLAPLYAAEREFCERSLAVVADARAAREMQEARLRKLRETGAKAKDAEEREAAQAEMAELMRTMDEVPSAPQLIADDVTPEALATLMYENDGIMAIMSAEGGFMGMASGRYVEKGGPNLDIILKGHSGDQLRVNRASDKEKKRPRIIPRPALTLLLMVQPEVLHQLAAVPGGRGRGLPARFLYSMPPGNVGHRLYRDRVIDPDARRCYEGRIRRMLEHPVSEDGEPRSLRLSDEAFAGWVSFYDEIEARMAEGGDLREIADWGSKAAGAVARIAGGLHLIEHADARPEDVPISGPTMQSAVTIGNYFVEHARAAFALMGDSTDMKLARRIFDWIERHQKTEFSLRELHQHIRTDRPRDLEPGLSILEDRSIIRRRSIPPQMRPGRKPGPRYEVNPFLGDRSQNSQNSGSTDQTRESHGAPRCLLPEASVDEVPELVL